MDSWTLHSCRVPELRLLSEPSYLHSDFSALEPDLGHRFFIPMQTYPKGQVSPLLPSGAMGAAELVQFHCMGSESLARTSRCFCVVQSTGCSRAAIDGTMWD